MSYKIAHIINVVEDRKGNPSYLNTAQPITIKSMVKAYIEAGGRMPNTVQENMGKIELYSIQLAHEKQREMPVEFNVLPPLQKNINHYHDFSKPQKPLPRIYDILKALYQNSDAEYFIYTNVDIGVNPHFYNSIRKLIDQGYDAACINRRNIHKIWKGTNCSAESMEVLYEAVGKMHGGKDCFLFRRDIFPKFNFSNMVIGYPPIGSYFLEELQRHSKNFIWLKKGKDNFMTFHIGYEEEWREGSTWINGEFGGSSTNDLLLYNLTQQRWLYKHYAGGHSHPPHCNYNQFKTEVE